MEIISKSYLSLFLKSTSTFPVLLRKPWNQDLSGVLAVNTYDEFLVLVDQVKTHMIDTKPVPKQPCVIALVGPSGSNKNELADMLRAQKIAVPIHSFNKENVDPNVTTITDSIYGGKQYTMLKSNFDYALNVNKETVVCTVDMCGALTLKRTYPTVIVFCKRSRELMIADVIGRKEMSDKEKTLRLLSMEQELRNEKLCDHSVRTENVTAAADVIAKLFK